MEGDIPKRALAMIEEWAVAHKEELLQNWELALEHKSLSKIQPLD